MDLKCPTCQKEIEWSSENKHRPFCSHRCKLIDLGEWANEENRTISRPIFPLEGLDEEIEQSLEDPDKLH